MAQEYRDRPRVTITTGHAFTKLIEGPKHAPELNLFTGGQWLLPLIERRAFDLYDTTAWAVPLYAVKSR